MRQELFADRAVRPQTQRAVFQYVQLSLAFLVAKCGRYFMPDGQNLIANGAADNQIITAGLRAGRFNHIFIHDIAGNVSGCSDRTSFRLAAARAGAGLYAVCRAGSGRRFRPLAPFMAERRNLGMLAGNDRMTDRAADHHIIAADFRAGRGNLILLCRLTGRVAGCINHDRLRLAAAGAGVGLVACFRAGGVCDHPFAPFVAECGNFCMLAADLGVANRAVDDHVVTASLGAGRFFFVFFNGIARRMRKLADCNSLTSQFSSADFAVHNLVVAAEGCAGRNRHVFNDSVAFRMLAGCRDHNVLTGDLFAALRAVDDHVIAAVFHTGRCDFVLLHRFAGDVSVQELDVHRHVPAVGSADCLVQKADQAHNHPLQRRRVAQRAQRRAQRFAHFQTVHRDLRVVVQCYNALTDCQRRARRKNDLYLRLSGLRFHQRQVVPDILVQCCNVVEVVQQQIVLCLELKLLRADLQVSAVLDQNVAVVSRLRRRRHRCRQGLPGCSRLLRFCRAEDRVIVFVLRLRRARQLIAVRLPVDMTLDLRTLEVAHVLKPGLQACRVLHPGFNVDRVRSRSVHTQARDVRHSRQNVQHRCAHNRILREHQRCIVIVERRAGDRDFVRVRRA